MSKGQHYSGLTEAQVLESRKKYGANVFTAPQKTTLWDNLKKACTHWIALIIMGLSIVISAIAIFAGGSGNSVWVTPAIALLSTILIILVGFFGGFKDALFKILITAFVLSLGISIYKFEWEGASYTVFFEPVGIIVALLLATGVAFFLERRNEKTFQALNEVNDDTLVKVVRNNNVSQVPKRDIVVGDIIILETGEEVPADCELLESLNLLVNESSLTGELQASKSTKEEHFKKDATYPSNHILKGTIIIEGYCTARVFNVGDNTESGKVYEAAQVNEGNPTPLSEKLDKLAKHITKGSYFVAALIVVGRIISFFISCHNFEWLDFISYLLNTFMIAVTLIVVAVPEGLPMSVTLSLALSMRKLMKENTLPRTMHSCETMGATSVICTDKTGTLTQNQMQVADEKLEDIKPELIEEMIAVNSTANLDFSNPQAIKAIGNPTEGALLLWLNARGINYLTLRERVEVIDRLPFSTENKYMATIASSRVLGKRVLYVKGAPEIILAFSNISEEQKKKYEQILLDYQNKAMRTLALAYLELEDGDNVFLDGKLTNVKLNFAGIFAISDPVRTEVPASIQECINAGIQVKIVTGDTPGTAKEIGRQIGLWTDEDGDRNILTGSDFAEMTDDELASLVQGAKIVSRAKPNDKERLVKLLKKQGLVVAVTGDGTNDAPALNAADVGLSMGDGTAVAKEASDMTIQDNSFSTIASAVMWGRSLYKNIQRFIMFQMTINVVACLIVLIGAFIGTQSPLSVTQMLWVNLIMDTFAAIALASLPPTHKVMQEPPRKDTDSIINIYMKWNILGVGVLFTIILLCILLIMQHSAVESVQDLIFINYGAYDGLSDYELSMFFTIFVMMQFWNMFNAKAFMTGKSAFADIKDCQGFMLIAVVIFIGQILIVEFGGKMFNVTPLKPLDWGIIIATTSSILWAGEIIRLSQRN
ncbi:MAG: calcium-translocating P-type ATPase, PMCA-type [Muribaculaceae bacterium]|nr:calcium-translocating P-type ATPase, PMCA-type [Muribaculaceae bacterium]